MNTIKVFAIILILVGILGLAYGGFTYTSDTHSVNIGPLKLAVKEENTVNIPMWAGTGVLAVGGGMLFARKLRKKG